MSSPRRKRSPYDSKAYRQARKRLRGHPCQICGAPPPSEVDHIQPLALGGTNEPENLRPLCRTHNRSLGAKLGNRLRKRRHQW